MLALILLIISGAAFAFFATQNTHNTEITLASYTFDEIPMYAIVLGSLLLGILVSWVISFFGFVSSSLTILGKNRKIGEGKKEIGGLEKQIHDLELENERLKGEAKSSS